MVADQPRDQRAPVSVETLPRKLDEEASKIDGRRVRRKGLRASPKSKANYIKVNADGPFKEGTIPDIDSLKFRFRHARSFLFPILVLRRVACRVCPSATAELFPEIDALGTFVM